MCARMIPSVMQDDTHSFGERQVFKALKEKLPDEYVVFHSIKWNAVNEKHTVIWGECDFTILHPTKGVLVIEVKSGGISCKNEVWEYVRTDNNERYPMKNPLYQAERSLHKFSDDIIPPILDGAFDYYDRPCYSWVGCAVWFPSISSRDVEGRFPDYYKDEIVLYENALDNPQKYIDRAYGFYDAEKHTNLTPSAFESLVQGLAPYYRASVSLRARSSEQEESFIRLTDEQFALLNYLEEQPTAAIHGAAGTGKTLIAVNKSQRLAKEGKVLFLCHNTFLKDHLRRCKETSPKEYANIDFFTLKQLVSEKLSAAVDDKDILAFLKHYDQYDWDYKHIIIDEAQDFNDDHLEELKSIAFYEDGSFYTFFDKYQFVQGRKEYDNNGVLREVGFPKCLSDADCKLVLSVNCRNTKEIAETSLKSIGIDRKQKIKAVNGDQPSFYRCDSSKIAISIISKQIDKYRLSGFSYSDICILTVKTETTSILSDMSSPGHLPVKKIGNHNLSSLPSDNAIWFTSTRKFKGLEAKAIIIVDVDANTFSNIENKMLFYVGSSRAKSFLDIVFVGSDDELSALAKNLDSKSRRAVTTLATKLSVKPL